MRNYPKIHNKAENLRMKVKDDENITKNREI